VQPVEIQSIFFSFACLLCWFDQAVANAARGPERSANDQANGVSELYDTAVATELHKAAMQVKGLEEENDELRRTIVELQEDQSTLTHQMRVINEDRVVEADEHEALKQRFAQLSDRVGQHAPHLLSVNGRDLDGPTLVTPSPNSTRMPSPNSTRTPSPRAPLPPIDRSPAATVHLEDIDSGDDDDAHSSMV